MCVCVSVIWNCGTISEHSRFGCNHSRLKFNEMETDAEFLCLCMMMDAQTHSAWWTIDGLVMCALQLWKVAPTYFAQKHIPTRTHTTWKKRKLHMTSRSSSAGAAAKSSTVYIAWISLRNATDSRKRSLNKNLFSSIKKQGAICSSEGGGIEETKSAKLMAPQ